MTTFTFAPSPQAPWMFQPTLDGQIYTGVITWNLAAQRWYLNLYSLAGALVVAKALVGSPPAIPIAAVAWTLGTATVTTQDPHGYPPGATIVLTIAGVTPSGYNGTVSALITGPSTFTYSLASFPGLATAFGQVSYDINLVQGYFTTSTMVFRQASQQFEVNP
jgi:hypothetical protein